MIINNIGISILNHFYNQLNIIQNAKNIIHRVEDYRYNAIIVFSLPISPKVLSCAPTRAKIL
jgi:hypothetical protein